MTRKSNDSVDKRACRAYAYHGADDAHKRASLERLAAELVDPELRDFDLETLYGPEVTADRLLTAAAVAPLASKQRLVVITEANDIPTAEQQAIAGRLERVPESACVVFITPAPEMDDGKPKRKDELHPELMGAVKKVGKAVDFPLMKDGPAANLVRELVSEAGKTISPTAAAAVVRRCGTDSGILATEVAKLVDFSGERRTITNADAAAVVSETIEEKVFDLMDAVGSRKPALALRRLHPLLHGGSKTEKAALRTLTMLARQFRCLWQARVLLDAGHRSIIPSRIPDDLRALLPEDSILKAKDWQQAKYMAQARNFTLDNLVRCFQMIAAADLAIKGIEGSITDPVAALEVLVIQLSTGR